MSDVESPHYATGFKTFLKPRTCALMQFVIIQGECIYIHTMDVNSMKPMMEGMAYCFQYIKSDVDTEI